MEFRRVQHFLAAAETLSLSAASLKMQKSPKAVQAQLMELEDELGVQLLHRIDNDRFELTAAGRSFAGDAVRIQDGLGFGRDAARRIAEGLGGVLGLGLCEEAATPWLSSVFRTFYAQFPGLGLRLVETSSEQLATALRRQEIDLALLMPDVDDSGLTIKPLWQDDWMIAVRSNADLPHRLIFVEDIAEDPLVLTRSDYGPSGHDVIRAAFAAAGLVPMIAAQTLSRSTALALRGSGVGHTFVPRSFSRGRATQRHGQRPFHAKRLSVAAAYRSAEPPGVAMQFLRTIEAACAAFNQG